MKTVSIVLLFLFTTAGGRVCSKAHKTYVKNLLLDQNANKKYVTARYGHYIELDCCASEGSEVTWRKWSNDANKWKIYLPDRTEVSFYDYNHILSIQSSTFEDTGLYRCSVQNDTYVTDVTHFQVNVIACDKLARGPYPTLPLPCPETTSQEEDTLTLPCTGYFGCEDEGDIRIATWFVSLDKNKKDDWMEAISVDKRYKQTEFQQDNGAVKGSNLTITEVLAVDFNRKFMCLLASPQMTQGQTRLAVTLKNNRPTVFGTSLKYISILIGVSALAVLSLVVIVVISVLTFYKKSRKSPRTIVGTSDQKWTPVRSRDLGRVMLSPN